VNKATLPIIARLQALQAASHRAPGGARVIAAIADASPLAALLREVNETVLPRSLMFESGDGSSLTLEVAGRRVLRVAAVTGLNGAEACIEAPTLEDEHKDDLIKLLQGVATPRHELRVVTGPVEREVDGVSVGLPVALLADLCLIELNEVDAEDTDDAPDIAASARPDPAPRPVSVPADPVAANPDLPELDFLGRLARDTGPTMVSWLISGGANDGMTEGPDEMVSHLRGFLEDEIEALTRQLDMVSMVPAGPVCLVLGASLVDGHSILCARAGDAMLLGVIEGDGTQTLLRAWNSASA
jgi:hypothetical protein